VEAYLQTHPDHPANTRSRGKSDGGNE
jgi:hypothetical protein